MIILLLSLLLGVWLYASLWFVLSLLLRRNDIADIAWGLGYLAIALYLSFVRPLNPAALCVFSLTAIWAIRLSGYIALRNRGKTEDFRYKQWREEWGRSFYLRSYLQVYLLQGLLMWVIASPLALAAQYGSGPLQPLSWAGIVIWAVGMFFQSVGDYQLAQFVRTRSHKEQVLQSGLWRYSRHPNYFGEIMIWWGIFLIVAPLPHGLFALISPLTITWLLVFVSGVPMLERRYAQNAAYQDYRRRTSALIPRPPKR